MSKQETQQMTLKWLGLQVWQRWKGITANPFDFAHTPINRYRVSAKNAGFKTVHERRRYYGFLRRMRAKQVLSKMERR